MGEKTMPEKSVLFIDDPTQWGYETRKLNIGGYEVSFAWSLDEANERLAVNEYDCVVVEPYDPDYDLNEHRNPLAELIRKLNHKAVVVVASTEPKKTFDKKYGLVMGKDYRCYMEKPFRDHDAVVVTLMSLVGYYK